MNLKKMKIFMAVYLFLITTPMLSYAEDSSYSCNYRAIIDIGLGNRKGTKELATYEYKLPPQFGFERTYNTETWKKKLSTGVMAGHNIDATAMSIYWKYSLLSLNLTENLALRTFGRAQISHLFLYDKKMEHRPSDNTSFGAGAGFAFDYKQRYSIGLHYIQEVSYNNIDSYGVGFQFTIR